MCMGYLGFAAVISLAALRSDAVAVKHVVQVCFWLLCMQDAKRMKLLSWSVPLVTVGRECWLMPALCSDLCCFWAEAIVL